MLSLCNCGLRDVGALGMCKRHPALTNPGSCLVIPAVSVPDIEFLGFSFWDHGCVCVWTGQTVQLILVCRDSCLLILAANVPDL